MENFKHSLTVENKSKVLVTDTLEVLSFSDKEIKLKLKDNTILTIEGDNLKILSFDNLGGDFTMQGKINLLKYREKNETFVKRVFK